jgi:alpha-2-macroglobulin
MRKPIYLLLFLLLSFSGSLSGQTSEVNKALIDAEELLQGRQYNKAITSLQNYIKLKDSLRKDYASYLSIVAHYYLKKDAEAITLAKSFVVNYPKSQWIVKAQFLLAQVYIRQKKHEEANALYESAAKRLLAQSRKERHAQLLMDFARALSKEPALDDLESSPANFAKSLQFYKQVFQMDIGRKLKDEVQYRVARTLQKLNKFTEAEVAYRNYLQEFDPTWSGAVGSPERFRGQLKEKPGEAGKYRLEARFFLIEVQLNRCDQKIVITRGLRHQKFVVSRQAQSHLPRLKVARQNTEDLINLLKKEGKENSAMMGDAYWTRVRTYNLPYPSSLEIDAGIDGAREFVKLFPKHPRATDSSRMIALTYKDNGRVEDAIAAYRDFISGKNFIWVPEDGKVNPKIKTGKSCAATFKKWNKAATYEIGYLRFTQKNYPEAIKQWQHYINKYPNGKHWSECQSGIIQSQYKMALGLVVDQKYDEARKHFERFLKDYPLESRSRQILFILGQIHLATGEALEKDKPKNKEDIKKAYELAVKDWTRLISKYPATEESSLALFRVAKIQEEKFGSLEQALASYMRLKWGSYKSLAATKVKELTSHKLKIETERIFRTNEPALVKLKGRNLKKVTVSQYFVNLDSYFRKAHRINNIEDLDIDLIEADKTWEVEIKDYQKYKVISQNLKIPFPQGKPGACIIRVSGDEFEATTLVVRSDLDIIAKSSRREALVFVMNRLKNEPAENVKVLFTDGKKIIGSGLTGQDGVFKVKIDGLKNQQDIRVFVQGKAGLASSSLNLNGLKLSKGMSTKAYIYSDKSIYRPGEQVSFRAIIRDVKDSVYHIPAGTIYKVQVYDSSSRLIKTLELKLNEFGSLVSKIRLPSKARVGNYRIVISKNKERYTGSFEVQNYRLEKIRTQLAFSKKSYFRGELIQLKIKAEYYWGEPVIGRLLTYYLPDGRQFTDRTDEQGMISVQYDAAGFAAGSWLVFKANVNGTSQKVQKSVLLAAQGFSLQVTTLQKLALSNETFELNVKSVDSDQKPVGKKLTLKIYRYAEVKMDKVLGQVPWVKRRQSTSLAETLVEERDILTDPKTGEVMLNLKLKKGGDYIVRVIGRDKYGNTISTADSLKISDDDDKTRIRFFAKKSTYNVGAKIPLKLHSRLDESLALLTYEGEDIIDYKVIKFRKGMSQQDIHLNHQYFPNFRVSVSTLNGDQLHTAHKDFNVERQLNIAVKLDKKVYLPGEKSNVTISVMDQLGRPVEAELTLALVNEALFDIYKERRSKIINYFQKSQKRFVEFRVATTAGFHYGGVTKKRQKSMEQELLRLAQHQRERQRLLTAQRGVYGSYDNGAVIDRTQLLSQNAISMNSLNFIDENVEEIELDDQMEDRHIAQQGDEEVMQIDSKHDDNILSSAWLTDIKTDEKGQASLELVLPAEMSQWRLTTIGTTKGSLFGESTAKIITRKDFFIELNLPAFAQEGDVIDIMGRIHNLTDFEGEVKIKFTVNGKVVAQALKIKPMSLKTVVFNKVSVPAADFLNLAISADTVKNSENLSLSLPIRPWGIEFRNRTGGIMNKSIEATLNLPDGQTYHRKRLMISLSSGYQKGLIQMALGKYPKLVGIDADHFTPIPYPRAGFYTPSLLLSAISGYKYARQQIGSKEDLPNIVEKIERLTTELIATQEQGGGWKYEGVPSWQYTARAYWALVLCQQEGFHVDSLSLQIAGKYLKDLYRQIRSDDSDNKAEILYVLSLNKQADFSNLNRLYRERVRLNGPGLAYLALAYSHLDRREIAMELMGLLEKKEIERDGHVFFEAVKKRSFHNGLKTTALALMLYSSLKPKDPKAQKMADWLMSQKGAFYFASSRFSGPVIAALTQFYEKKTIEQSNFEVSIFLNDQLIKQVSSKDLNESIYLSLPDQMIKGKNQLRIDYKGRGKLQYGATISGFSAEMRNPKSFGGSYFKYRRYYHDNIMYKNTKISATSNTQVHNAVIGQRILVSERISSDYTNQDYVTLEEFIPAGMLLVDGSIKKGNASRYEIGDGKITFFFKQGYFGSSISYELIAFVPGQYRTMPSVIRDRNRSGRILLGTERKINVLKPGEKSKDTYTLNFYEHRELAKLYFDDKNYEKALVHLNHLFKTSQDPELARMLLWIHATEEYYDSAKVVNCFEILREKDPEQYIPFEKILVIGKSYGKIKEYERAWLVYRATIDSSFVKDTKLSAVLEDQGQYTSSMNYLENLWLEYPDRADVVSSYLAWSNDLFTKAPQAEKLAISEKRIRRLLQREGNEMPNKKAMLERSIHIARQFMTLYPESLQADDAAFALLNTFFTMDDYKEVVRAARSFRQWFPKSNFKSSFEYMNALGHFWQYEFAEALKLTMMVAAGESKDQQYAKYITAQIFHTQGKAPKAIEWYEKVKHIYPDALQSIDYFEEEKVSIDEVSSFKPGEKVQLKLSYRNIKEASFQVYKVDLMKLYLREKNLSNITKVNLAGIAPALEMTVQLGNGKDYANKEKEIQLGLKDEGAYLVICRGDDLFASGLVLISPLKLEVQEDSASGSMRVNVINSVKKNFVPKVHVKAIGSSDKDFKSGETDLRGLFVTTGINGLPTVIVRSGKSHYAFYRGKEILGQASNRANRNKNKKIFQQQKQLQMDDYLQNSILDNDSLNRKNIGNWNMSRRGGRKGGVQIKEAK